MPRGSNLSAFQLDILIWSTVILVGFGEVPLFSTLYRKTNFDVFRFFTLQILLPFQILLYSVLSAKGAQLMGNNWKVI